MLAQILAIGVESPQKPVENRIQVTLHTMAITDLQRYPQKLAINVYNIENGLLLTVISRQKGLSHFYCRKTFRNYYN